jgi:hypothetical protein
MGIELRISSRPSGMVISKGRAAETAYRHHALAGPPASAAEILSELINPGFIHQSFIRPLCTPGFYSPP